jgi:hypothetical protein
MSEISGEVESISAASAANRDNPEDERCARLHGRSLAALLAPVHG